MNNQGLTENKSHCYQINCNRRFKLQETISMEFLIKIEFIQKFQIVQQIILHQALTRQYLYRILPYFYIRLTAQNATSFKSSVDASLSSTNSYN